MKRSSKALLIIACCLLVIGILLFVCIMAVNRFQFRKLSTQKFVTNTVEIKDDFTNISILSDTEDIVFVKSTDGKTKVEFFENEKELHTAVVNSGTLEITSIDTRTWTDHFGFSFDSPKTTVYLSKDKYDTLAIHGSTGDVKLPKDFSFSGISVLMTTGDIQCEASCSGKLQLEADTGDITLSGAKAGEITLKVSTGRITVNSVESKNGLGITVSTGKTILTDVSCNTFTSTGNTGDITMKNLIVTMSIDIRRTTGDVSFESCDAAELVVQTDTGDVTGSLLSSKVFITKTDTGRVDVPETTTGGTCKITTDTGDIKIVTK